MNILTGEPWHTQHRHPVVRGRQIVGVDFGARLCDLRQNMENMERSTRFQGKHIHGEIQPW